MARTGQSKSNANTLYINNHVIENE